MAQTQTLLLSIGRLAWGITVGCSVFLNSIIMEEKDGSNHTIKMRMRNLRAKVRLLLPDYICNHYKDRSARVEKFEIKRQKSTLKIRESYPKDHWRRANKKPQPWYFERFEPPHIFAQFHRLSTEELDEIADNKHYFLTEKYVQPFEQYYLKENHPPNEFKIPQRPIKKHRQCQSTAAPVVVPNQVILHQHVKKQHQRRKVAQQRYQAMQQIQKSKSLQKEGLIEARMMKAMNIREEIGELKSESNRISNTKRTFNIKNVEKLQSLRSQRTEIVRLTSELKRVCTLRLRSSKHPTEERHGASYLLTS